MRASPPLSVSNVSNEKVSTSYPESEVDAASVILTTLQIS